MISDEELLFFFGMCIFDLVNARNYKDLLLRLCARNSDIQLFRQEELLRFSFNAFDANVLSWAIQVF